MTGNDVNLKKRSFEEEEERVARELREAAERIAAEDRTRIDAQRADTVDVLPPLPGPPPHPGSIAMGELAVDPGEGQGPSRYVRLKVPFHTQMEILQSVISPSAVGGLTETEIADILGDYFQRRVGLPVEIDWGPYEERLSR